MSLEAPPSAVAVCLRPCCKQTTCFWLGLGSLHKDVILYAVDVSPVLMHGCQGGIAAGRSRGYMDCCRLAEGCMQYAGLPRAPQSLVRHRQHTITLLSLHPAVSVYCVSPCRGPQTPQRWLSSVSVSSRQMPADRPSAGRPPVQQQQGQQQQQATATLAWTQRRWLACSTHPWHGSWGQKVHMGADVRAVP
jgi:hypothetical protein